MDSCKDDWGNLEYYRKANAQLHAAGPDENRVVFMGNSITEEWIQDGLGFFDNDSYINRGISGQTTPQMLIRFPHDVVALQPAVVVILAGINDIAGNAGPTTTDMIAENIFSMVEIAKANDIEVVLSAVLPAAKFSGKPGIQPAEKVIELNQCLKDYATRNELVYIDYFTPMADEKNGLKAELTYDGVHPNQAGYSVMEPLAEAAVAVALARE